MAEHDYVDSAPTTCRLASQISDCKLILESAGMESLHDAKTCRLGARGGRNFHGRFGSKVGGKSMARSSPQTNLHGVFSHRNGEFVYVSVHVKESERVG